MDKKFENVCVPGEDLRHADLSGADLSRANLVGANLRHADLNGANLSGANLRHANLSDANLSGADLIGADLSGANLIGADLRCADLSGAGLSDADLRHAKLMDTNLTDVDLSGAIGLKSQIDFMEEYFEKIENGYIAYKTFNECYVAPRRWDIKSGSILTENVNFDRMMECGCGINVAPYGWVKRRYANSCIWKVLIRFEWLSGVCVPYNSDGKIRCEQVELIEEVK